ncbi:peroxisomal membrane family protein [Thecamonas trahens ATCC 50062]|uniref:Peroxisomal membrane family protein n=1 Tax=Thecamonas trahens ATCC 50062 TaxID=461836 RepID=A0A0L0DF48_THETB|nr:peroxisomal membrane family protein [Thecamonas trahens ATCC 50062]KNC50766.1 peroxisomal membrane family protein [Thecamonas trahens ATCC 50062]|eukprot:XP_013756728.1 peroxisomal membrane family protein [Thecamonas trahens ATCC 50062]
MSSVLTSNRGEPGPPVEPVAPDVVAVAVAVAVVVAVAVAVAVVVAFVLSRAGMRAVAARALRVPKERPFAFGMVFSGCKTSFADGLIQKVVEKRETMDWRRNASFALFGFVYLGAIQYALYVPVFQRIFPYTTQWLAKPIRARLKDTRGLRTMLAQVGLDQCVHHPLMYFPAFYGTKVLVNGGSVAQARAEYVGNLPSDMVALWKIWVPATIINFTVSPLWFRIPFVACTSLVWTCILSAMRGAMEAESLVDDDADFLGNQGRALQDSIRLFQYDSVHNMRVVISAVGPGADVSFLPRIAGMVHDFGGNCYESKMIQLGGEAAYIMMVAVDRGHYDELREALLASGLNVVVRVPESEWPAEAAGSTESDASDPETTADVSQFIERIDALPSTAPLPGAAIRRAFFSLYGPDRPGLVRDLAQFFAKHALAIDDMDTAHASTSYGEKFTMRGQVSLTATEAQLADLYSDLVKLRAELSQYDIVLRFDEPEP